jgi:aspartate aminotransferase-like enzyme
MLETEAYGFDKVCTEQHELGRRIRELMVAKGFPSVAAEGFQAPGVVVSYTTDPDIHSGKKFLAQGLQTAAGVPLQCDEPADYRSFRIGLFGLEKLHDPAQTVRNFAKALEAVQAG